jgi:hypothetical protein
MFNSASFSNKDLKIKLPSGMVISGATSSGKTSLLMRIIQFNQELFDPAPQQILYCYGQIGAHVYMLQAAGIECWEGLPPNDKLENSKKPLLLIFDDLMSVVTEKYISDIFTKRSHHQNIGVIFITQNLFDRNIRVARNNAQYMILTRSLNSMQSIRNVGQQLFPRRLDYFLSAYSDATKDPYGYLFIDLHAASSPILHLRTDIFPDDKHKTIFIPKNAP